MGNIVKSEEIDEFIEEGIFQFIDELDEIQKDSCDFLAHKCTEKVHKESRSQGGYIIFSM